MQLPRLSIFIFILLLSFIGCQQDSPRPAADWPDITQENKAWTRWWWHGSSVTEAGITAELEAYKKAGIGGLELTPIYGVIGEEDAFIEYLSPQWVDMLVFTLQEAKRLGLGMDMATGTGWPFGGPWVDTSDASKYLAHKTFTLKGGQQLKEAIRYKENGFVRAVSNQAIRKEAVQLSDLIEPVAQNQNLQALALDQVRFSKALPLQSLVAYSEAGEIIDLMDKLDPTGSLDWMAPAGNWTLYAIFEAWHGKMVERAAPGGEGNVIDHFSTEAIQHYVERFDQAFSERDLSGLRAFFNDSYEVDDARGQANWTPKLLEAFQQKQGYDLRQHWPTLLEKQGGEKHQRILSDYRETISDLLLETFAQTWGEWARSQDKIIRYQAHGSPSNILDLYAVSEIPEAEGTDLIRIKFASSAAHVANRKLASAEAATWLNEHFTSDLASLKENLDRYLIGGINHLFYHGSCYSPPADPWPGRLFYAAIHANPRNSLWQDFGYLNQYVARTQSFLQAGESDNNVLLYFPAYDRFATAQKELLDHFNGHGPNLEDTHFAKLADTLLHAGFAFDYISDRQIQGLSVRQGRLSTGGTEFKTLLIPETQYMPLATLQKLADLAAEGAKIIFQNKLPELVPGLDPSGKRQSEFTALLDQVRFSTSVDGVATYPTAKGQWLKGPDALSVLAEAGIRRESLVDHDLAFARRTYQNGKCYFLTNWSATAVDTWVPIETEAQSVMLFDPMTGNKGVAKTRKGREGATEVWLQLAQGASMIMTSSAQETAGEAWPYWEKTEQMIALNKNWELAFIAGGPSLPESVSTDTLGLWTDWDQAQYQAFSGTARYTTSFSGVPDSQNAWLLDLGEVYESARVTLNGQELGVLIGPVFQIVIPANLMQAENTLQVEVSNLMANRIIDLEKRGVAWKRFYNINFPPRKRENMGPAGIFEATNWEPLPSGLQGPVQLRQVKPIP